ncbi:glycosyltransferase [Thiopseudomonas alkaliphila]|uniref:glycosyltransferase n=1 Tax=Thiopseudomonas alkaliphila TaxID=1697053 RepID=UPI003570C38A
MRVLLVITGLGMGGAEHVVCNLADELAKQGHEVKIAYLLGPVLVSPKNKNIELINIGVRSIIKAPRACLKLRRVVADFRPDVVHSHMFHSNVLMRLIRMTVKIPRLISTAHNTNEGGKLRMLAYRYTDFLADITTNVSQEAVTQFILKKAVPSNKIVAIANGIDTNRFEYSADKRAKIRSELELGTKKMLLAVGRLDIQKDYPNLLSAISELKNHRQDFKLFIVGDGPLRSKLQGLLEELKLSEFVCFLGIRKDIPDLMSAADLFVLSSAWEGFGLVVGEAMACERVVVATDCGGVKEVIGSCGVLVEKKAPAKLAASLKHTINLTEDESAELGKAARERIIDFYSIERNMETYFNLYSK